MQMQLCLSKYLPVPIQTSIQTGFIFPVAIYCDYVTSRTKTTLLKSTKMKLCITLNMLILNKNHN